VLALILITHPSSAPQRRGNPPKSCGAGRLGDAGECFALGGRRIAAEDAVTKWAFRFLFFDGAASCGAGEAMTAGPAGSWRTLFVGTVGRPADAGGRAVITLLDVTAAERDAA